MLKTIEVEIDESGLIRPVESTLRLPAGRAILSWPVDEGASGLLLSERALADWLRPEEEEAWAYLQPAK
jgi:hypothetical protein